MPQRNAKRPAGLVYAMIFFLLLARPGQAKPQNPEPFERVPEELSDIRLTMGQGKYAEAHERIDRWFEKKEIYPALFETAASLYVFENRFAEGHAYFDSLLAQGQPRGEVAGAKAILYHVERQPELSLQHARVAVLEDCQSVWPYEIFILKSFELDSGEAALDLLRRQRQRQPQNWRLRYAFASGLASKNKVKEACDSLQALLQANLKHGRIFYVLGLYRGYLGDWDGAERTYHAGLAHNAFAQDDQERARLLHGLAEALLMKGNPDSARQVLHTAFTLVKKLDDRFTAYRLLLLSGRIHMQSFQPMEARRNLISAAEQAHQFSDGRMLLHAYYYLADLDRQVGKNSEALNYTIRTYEVADSLGLKAFALQLLNGIGIIDLEAGHRARAYERFKENERIAHGKAPEAHRSVYLQNMGSVAFELGKYQEALAFQEEASRLAQKGGDHDNLLKLGLLRGKILHHLGRLDQARKLLTEVSARARAKKRMATWVPAQLQLARLEVQSKKLVPAKTRLAQIAIQMPGALPYVENLEILCLLADIAWQSGNASHALETYHSALELIASRTHRLSPGTLSSLSSAERQIFFGLAQAYLQKEQVEQALLVTESARDLIVKRKRWQARLLGKNRPNLAARGRLAALDSLLLQTRFILAATASADQRLLQSARLRSLELEHAALLDSVLGMQPSPLLEQAGFELSRFQKTLRARSELAFDFFVGDSSTLVFFIAPDTLRAAAVPVGRQALEQQLLRMHQGVSVSNSGSEAHSKATFDKAAAHALYRTLLQDFLTHDRRETAMAIVPDNVLHALPFEMLVVRAPVHSRAEFLVERFAIRHGNTLANLQQEEQDDWRVRSFLLAAAPALQRNNTTGWTPRNGNWIIGTVGGLEAKFICSLVKCRRELTGAKLTRASLLQAMQDSDWLHIASHCFWQPAEPLFGEIVLSIPPGGSKPEALFAFEIFHMNLPVRMAILSGCETVRGTFIESEGFEGFVQAFRAAGTPSVIASLWKVDDHPTAEFFKAYYEALRAGQSTVRALQTAKLKLLNHPDYDFTHWAAFAYYGRDWQVELPAPWGVRDGIVLATIIAILLLAGGLLRMRKNRKTASL